MELPNGPRITVATAPEPNIKRMEQRNQAVNELAALTGWNGVGTSEGLSLVREKFPKRLSDSQSESLSAPTAWRTFVLDFVAADTHERERLSTEMRQKIAEMSDPELSRRMSEMLEDFVTLGIPDDSADGLLKEMGEHYGNLIQGEANVANSRAEKRGQKFESALRTIDAVDAAEKDSDVLFQQEVSRTETLARDNLAYFEAAGYVAAFGRNFDDFLSILNAHRLKIYPNAGAPITLPMALTEPDRVLMAHAFIRAIGTDATIDEYFDIPSYRLRQFDAAGNNVNDMVDRGLKDGGIWADGVFNPQALERRLISPPLRPGA